MATRLIRWSRAGEHRATIAPVRTTSRRNRMPGRLPPLAAGPRLTLAGTTSQAAAMLTGFGAGEMQSYLEILLRLVALALLAILALGFLRVMVEFKVDQRRKRRLADTRDIRELAPSEFEAYVAVLFEKTGYRVRRTGGSGDHGVDLRMVRDGTRYVVQCKRYEETIGPSTVREMIGAMTNAGVRRGFLVTTSDFSAGAESEASDSPYQIDLIDGPALVRWARTHGLPAEAMKQGPSEG